MGFFNLHSSTLRKPQGVRINRCVRELNQKYFIQFLFYTGLASLYTMGLVLPTWLGLAGRSLAVMVAGDVTNNRVCHVDQRLLEQLLKQGLKEMNLDGLHPMKLKLVLMQEALG